VADYTTTPFTPVPTRQTLPTNTPAEISTRQDFRTSVINIDRPGDASVFSEQIRADARELISRYPEGQAASALIPMLHLVQSEQGYVTPDGIAFCAEMVDLTKAQVVAVATFYTMFKRNPTGEFLVSVCTNTLCGMLGGDEIYAALADYLSVGHNETTDDGKITLEHAECLAACDYAPVVTVNYEFFDNQTIDSARGLVDQLKDGERPSPNRGAPLCTFKQIERQIAGFFDEETFFLDATATGGPTEVGVKLAIERGDTAPSYAVDRAGQDTFGAGPDTGEQRYEQPTSQHDAPLSTAESDPNRSAEPGGPKQTGKNQAE
jgi:NADH-quinone oxidoreductase subunit E